MLVLFFLTVKYHANLFYIEFETERKVNFSVSSLHLLFIKYKKMPQKKSVYIYFLNIQCLASVASQTLSALKVGKCYFFSVFYPQRSRMVGCTKNVFDKHVLGWAAF